MQLLLHLLSCPFLNPRVLALLPFCCSPPSCWVSEWLRGAELPARAKPQQRLLHLKTSLIYISAIQPVRLKVATNVQINLSLCMCYTSNHAMFLALWWVCETQSSPQRMQEKVIRNHNFMGRSVHFPSSHYSCLLFYMYLKARTSERGVTSTQPSFTFNLYLFLCRLLFKKQTNKNQSSKFTSVQEPDTVNCIKIEFPY